MSYIFEMLQQSYGAESVPDSHRRANPRSRVRRRDHGTGQVTGTADGRALLDVWCENQRGEQVIAGTAEVPSGYGLMDWKGSLGRRFVSRSCGFKRIFRS
jgi:hypothetical protein